MESDGSSRCPSPFEAIKNWDPEPLVPEIETTDHEHLLNPYIVTSKPGNRITVDGIECIDCATHNYLGLADDPRLETASIEATKKYGVGSCGPRGFYGTMDVHLKLEDELAKFLRVQEAVLYSYGFSTIASAIPAYAKSSDVIFVDELCNFAIQQGVVASRSRVMKFRHNDMDHLAQLIEDVMGEQRKKFGANEKLRTFLIVEGIYAKTGDLCPLDKILQLKHKHKIRLFIDESISFGVLGDSGRGITEHYKVDISDVDLTMASLEYAFCAYGGFCAGSSYIIDHQRLAGAGYCFSASLPPLQVQVALESLMIISQEPEIVLNAQDMYRYANQVLDNLSLLKNISDPISPVKVLVARPPHCSADSLTGVRCNESLEKILGEICNNILHQEHIALTVARYLSDEEMTYPLASIRLSINACLTKTDVDRVCAAIERFVRDSRLVGFMSSP